MKDKLTSRKFWLALIGGVVMLLNAFTGLELSGAEIAGVLIPIIAYIFGEAWVDGKAAKGSE
jgi:membrane-bound ClpP family serine protease